MLKYQLITAKAADSDGDWRMAIRVVDIDENQIASVFPLIFEATNGWTVKSVKVVEIDADDKEIFLPGRMAKRDDMMGSALFKKRDDMLKAKLEIEEALEEWAAKGGFEIPTTSEDFAL